MKILKGIVATILKIILFNVVFLFIVSFSIRGLFASSFVKDIVKEQLATEVAETLEIEDERVSKLLENEQINKLLGEYVDKTIDGMVNEEALNDVTISNDIINYIKENKVQIEQELGVPIDTTKLDEVLGSAEMDELNNEYRESISEMRSSMPESQKTLIKIYQFMISMRFKVILGIMIVVLVVLIALLQGSLYRWIRTLGSDILTSGIFVAIMGAIVSFIVNTALGEMEMNFVFKVTPLYVSALISVVVGIVMLVIYEIIKHVLGKNDEGNDQKLEKNEEEQDEVSEVLEG